jgi:hypothetical protein
MIKLWSHGQRPTVPNRIDRRIFNFLSYLAKLLLFASCPLWSIYFFSFFFLSLKSDIIIQSVFIPFDQSLDPWIGLILLTKNTSHFIHLLHIQLFSYSKIYDDTKALLNIFGFKFKIDVTMPFKTRFYLLWNWNICGINNTSFLNLNFL